MPYMRFAKSFQPNLANAFGKSEESCLHINGEGFDFRAHRPIEDFYSPKHNSVYLKFDIAATRHSWFW